MIWIGEGGITVVVQDGLAMLKRKPLISLLLAIERRVPTYHIGKGQLDLQDRRGMTDCIPPCISSSCMNGYRILVKNKRSPTG